MSLYHDYNRIINLDSSLTYQTVLEGNVEHNKKRGEKEKKNKQKQTKIKQKKPKYLNKVNSLLRCMSAHSPVKPYLWHINV